MGEVVQFMPKASASGSVSFVKHAPSTTASFLPPNQSRERRRPRRSRIMSHQTRHDRRQFVSAAALLAASSFGFGAGTAAASAAITAVTRATTASFGPIKQINAGLLNVALPRVGLLKDPSSSCSTDGHTISIASPKSRPCWPRKGTALSCLICEATEARAFSPSKACAMVSPRPELRT